MRLIFRNSSSEEEVLEVSEDCNYLRRIASEHYLGPEIFKWVSRSGYLHPKCCSDEPLVDPPYTTELSDGSAYIIDE